MKLAEYGFQASLEIAISEHLKALGETEMASLAVDRTDEHDGLGHRILVATGGGILDIYTHSEDSSLGIESTFFPWSEVTGARVVQAGLPHNQQPWLATLHLETPELTARTEHYAGVDRDFNAVLAFAELCVRHQRLGRDA